GPPEAGQAARPELEELATARQVALDERGGRRREQNLAAVAGVADARSLVDGEAHVAVAADRRLAGVEPHADANGRIRRPRVTREVALRLDGGADGRSGAPEDDHERIALVMCLDAVLALERRAQRRVVIG